MRKLSPAHVALMSLSIAWTTAMVSLWDWNVRGTGAWFAVLMIVAGVVVFTATLAHYMKWGGKIGDLFRKLFNRKK